LSHRIIESLTHARVGSANRNVSWPASHLSTSFNGTMAQ
jgi:hypothetical protein